MYRELNESWKFIGRFFYILYLACSASVWILLVIGFVHSRGDFLVGAALMAFLAASLKLYGSTYLDFTRLAESFPFESQQDLLPRTVRDEAEGLFKNFSAEHSQWQYRQELRMRLAELVKKEPLLLGIYSEEIYSVHPNLIAKMKV
ncbi:MAG: hypothetical protein KKE17_09480 [Proteobacteria bacterium]|nr:hypothetical protein [Pseudomonadota bacterium]MBU1710221.1 hypothetical protein [Pseudomonadota bacterium]